MDAINNADRRIFARFPTSLPIYYARPEGRKKASGEAVDISANGIGMVSSQGLPLHSAVDVWMDVPDTECPFYAKGEVAWVRWVWFNQYHIGILLKKVDLMGLSQIMHKINEYASKGNSFPSLSRWQRIKLRCIYYKSVIQSLFKQ